MARASVYFAGQWWPDPRGTRAWRKLRDLVVAEDPVCQLRLPGCTAVSTTADHIIPWADRPDLGMERSNLRGACGHCNSSRGKRAVWREAPAPALDWFD